MAIDPKSLTVSYKDLLASTSISDRVQLTKSKTGRQLLETLTPSQIAELFPDYYKKANPDVAGFITARTRAGLTETIGPAGQGHGSSASSGGRTGSTATESKLGGVGPGSRTKEGRTRSGTKKVELPKEEQENFRNLQNGGTLNATDPRAKYFSKMTPEQLARAGIIKERVGEGDQAYDQFKAMPIQTKAETMSDEEIVKAAASNQPFKIQSDKKAVDISDKDVDRLAKIMMAEAGNIKGSDGNLDLNARKAVIDTVLNRAMMNRKDFGSDGGIKGVIDHPKQFSPINSVGSVDNLQREVTNEQREFVRNHLRSRAAGEASSVGNSTHFLNPHWSGQTALAGWAQGWQGGKIFGQGTNIHSHFTPAGSEGAPQYNISQSIPPNATPEQIADYRQQLIKQQREQELNARLGRYQENVGEQVRGATADAIGRGNPTISQQSVDGSDTGWHNPTDVANRITSGFGIRSDPFLGGRGNHTGIDIAPARDEKGNYIPNKNNLYAAREGVVLHNEQKGGYGNQIMIEHTLPDGRKVRTSYSHMEEGGHIIDENGKKISLKKGDVIKGGQRIGTMGSTGRSNATHLHFETEIQGPDGKYSKVDPKTVGIYGETFDGTIKSVESLKQKQKQASAQAQQGISSPSGTSGASSDIYVSGPDGKLIKVPSGADPAAIREQASGTSGSRGEQNKPNAVSTSAPDAPDVSPTNVLPEITVRKEDTGQPPAQPAEKPKDSSKEGTDDGAASGKTVYNKVQDASKLSAEPIKEKKGDNLQLNYDGKPLVNINQNEKLAYNPDQKSLKITPKQRAMAEDLGDVHEQRNNAQAAKKMETAQERLTQDIQRPHQQQHERSKSMSFDFEKSLAPISYASTDPFRRKMDTDDRFGFGRSYGWGGINNIA